eukprot:1149787-Pelagomonas_calceolata.AAC.4
MTHSSDSKNLVGPNGAGITNTIGRAELAAIAAALTHEHTRFHRQPQLTPPTQTANPLSRKEQASCARRSGNENTDKITKYLASFKDNNLTDTGTPSAGPGANPFYNIALLDREEARPTTPELSYPIPNLEALNHQHSKVRSGTLHLLRIQSACVLSCWSAIGPQGVLQVPRHVVLQEDKHG